MFLKKIDFLYFAPLCKLRRCILHFLVYRHKDDINMTIYMLLDVLRISTKHKVHLKINVPMLFICFLFHFHILSSVSIVQYQ